MLNNMNIAALEEYIALVKDNPEEGRAIMGITADWIDGVNTKITTNGKKVGSKFNDKQFAFMIGEPEELLGDNQYPGPQDYMLGGMAGCMMVVFVAAATTRGIQLNNVSLTIQGQLDLRGFLNINPSVNKGFGALEFNFHVEGNGTKEQYDEIVAHVREFSPGYNTIANPVIIVRNENI